MKRLAALALCVAAGCAQQPDIATCIQVIEQTPASEHSLSKDYRQKCTYSLFTQDPNAIYEMMDQLPQQQKQDLVKAYIATLSPAEQLKITGNLAQEKAAGLFQVVKDYFCHSAALEPEQDWNDLPLQKRQQSYDRLRKMIGGD